MTIDERLATLAERHEALAQSVEILRDSVHENAGMVGVLGGLMEKLLVAMHTLADTVNSHERRLTDLDGGRA